MKLVGVPTRLAWVCSVCEAEHHTWVSLHPRLRSVKVKCLSCLGVSELMLTRRPDNQ